MLNTVSVLRRLLRKAFLVTNRVKVIRSLREGPMTGGRRWMRPSDNSIVEVRSDRQLGSKMVRVSPPILFPENEEYNSNPAADRRHSPVEIVIAAR